MGETISIPDFLRTVIGWWRDGLRPEPGAVEICIAMIDIMEERVARAETAEARYEKLTAIVQRIIAASDASDFECESEAIEEACAALAGDATGAGGAT